MVQLTTPIESPFNDRLDSNYAPTDDELVIIKELLSEPNQKLHNISTEIEGIRGQLEKLLKEREDLNDHLKAHKALLSPVRRLPSDVLQRIFMYCLPTGRNPVMSSKEAPILLGRICSQWRDISLATAKLWAAIHIAVPMDPPPPHLGGAAPYFPPQTTHHNLRIQGVITWLTRSEPYPLSISIYNPHYDSVGGATSWDLYLDAVVPFAPRWKFIRLSTSNQAWSSFWPRVRESDVPLLERVYLDCAVGYPSRPDSPDLGYGRECGLLKALNLRYISLVQFDPHILRLPLRWNQLAELNLAGATNTWQATKGLSITEALALLSLCPNLEYFSVQLSLAGFSPLPNGDHGLPKVKLNKLQGLSVTESGNTVDSSPFFQHIIAPSLRRLKFRRSATSRYSMGMDHMNPRKDVHVSLAMLIRQSKEAIEEFEMDASYIAEVDVMKCLSLMPGLKRLALWADTLTASGWTPPQAVNVRRWGNPFLFGSRNLKRFIPSQYLVGVVDPEGDVPDTAFLPEPPHLSPYQSPFASPSPTPSPSPPSPPHIPLLPPQVDVEPSGDDNNNGEQPAAEEGTSAIIIPPPGSPHLELQPPLLPPVPDSIFGADTDLSSAPGFPPISSYWGGGGKGKARAGDEDPYTDPLEFVDVSAFDVLCPLLEVFECSGVLFSDATMLAFIRSRSSLAESTLQLNLLGPASTSQTQLSSSSPQPPLPGPSTSSNIPQPSKSISGSVEQPPPNDNDNNNHIPGLAHLRKCRISFTNTRSESPETTQQLNFISQETGMALEVLYAPLPDNTQLKRFTPYDGVPFVSAMGGPLSSYQGGNGDWTTSHGNALSGEPVFLYSAAFY